MKKARFTLIMLLAVLLASPIAGLVYGILVFVFGRHGGETIQNASAFLLLSMAFSYFVGLIPSLIVASYVGFVVAKKRPFYIHRTYLVAIICSSLAASPYFTHLHGEDAFYLGAGLLVSFSVAFFVLYYLIRKLLPWAGTSLIEPTKAGTP